MLLNYLCFYKKIFYNKFTSHAGFVCVCVCAVCCVGVGSLHFVFLVYVFYTHKQILPQPMGPCTVHASFNLLQRKLTKNQTIANRLGTYVGYSQII